MMDEERLAGYFESIYEALSVRGVPEDRLPTPWSVLSHVLDCVDYEEGTVQSPLSCPDADPHTSRLSRLRPLRTQT
jgi:hypothetical protein